MASQYTFIACLHLGVDGDGVCAVEDLGGDILRYGLGAREVDVGIPFGGDLRTLIGEAHRAAAVEWQHVLLAGLGGPMHVHLYLLCAFLWVEDVRPVGMYLGVYALPAPC